MSPPSSQSALPFKMGEAIGAKTIDLEWVQGLVKPDGHYNGHKITKFYESGAALAQDMGVPVSKMEESIEASLKTASNPDGGPSPRLPERKSLDEASGKTGSGKKFYHNVISGSKFTSGLRGLRPRGRRSMCQVRMGRRCEGHFSRGACWWWQG